MPVVVVPILGLALLFAALGVLSVHHSNSMWLQPLLERLAHPKGNIFRRAILLPIAAGAAAVIKLLNYMRSVMSHWARGSLSAVTRFVHGLTNLAHLSYETTLTLANDTLHALSYLRHHTIPYLIHAAVAPVRALAHHAYAEALAAERFAHAAEKRLLHGIDRLRKSLEAWTLRQLHGIDRLIRERVLPGLRAVEREVAITIPNELALDRARLKRLEKLLGLGVIAGVVYKVLARVAPWIFCRNVKKVGNTVCGMNPNELSTLLQLLVGAFVIADLRQLTEFALSVEEDAAATVKDLLGA